MYTFADATLPDCQIRVVAIWESCRSANLFFGKQALSCCEHGDGRADTDMGHPVRSDCCCRVLCFRVHLLLKFNTYAN